MIDRLFVGATLMGITLVDTGSLPDVPLTQKVQEVAYPVKYESASACKQQLEFLKQKHRITNLKCVPDA